MVATTKLFVELTWAEAGAVIAGGVTLGGIVFAFLKVVLADLRRKRPGQPPKQPSR